MAVAESQITLGVARWAASLTAADVPRDVVAQSKLLILDAIGVGIAGSRDEVGAALRQHSTFLGTGTATAISVERPLAAADAAFVNGTLIHALDFDDMLFGGHATTCVLPAVLALGEATRLSGEEVLTSYVAGMEVFGRLAQCVPSAGGNVPAGIHASGFHPTGALGLIGAVVGAGRALSLDGDILDQAIAIAASAGCGLAGNLGSMVKPIHAGTAAAGGVKSAQLALSGVTGCAGILERPDGFGTAYMGGRASWEPLVERLGNPFRLGTDGPSIKKYPCCGANHPVIVDALQLKEAHHLTPENIAEVEVVVNPAIQALRFDWPTSPSEAKFSVSFNVAASLVYGAPTINTFDEQFNDHQIRELWARVKVVTDEEIPRYAPRVSVVLSSGERFSSQLDQLPGTPKLPFSTDEVAEKFFACCDGSLSERNARRLFEAIMAIEESPDDFWDMWASLRVPA